MMMMMREVKKLHLTGKKSRFAFKNCEDRTRWPENGAIGTEILRGTWYPPHNYHTTHIKPENLLFPKKSAETYFSGNVSGCEKSKNQIWVSFCSEFQEDRFE